MFIHGHPAMNEIIFLNRARQKQLIYDGPLLCGLPTLYDHLPFPYVYGNHELFFYDVCGVGMFFFYRALLSFFPFTKYCFLFSQQGTIPAYCERTAKVSVFDLKSTPKRKKITYLRAIFEDFSGFPKNWVACPSKSVGSPVV